MRKSITRSHILMPPPPARRLGGGLQNHQAMLFQRNIMVDLLCRRRTRHDARCRPSDIPLQNKRQNLPVTQIARWSRTSGLFA